QGFSSFVVPMAIGMIDCQRSEAILFLLPPGLLRRYTSRKDRNESLFSSSVVRMTREINIVGWVKPTFLIPILVKWWVSPTLPILIEMKL
ncbi:MAG: hypothetical protein SVO26_06650, partial [Chloroflexota bacterium]|nr:hypothetical protein [Chloroflexota bacterium]